jgi:hypothetical protein
VNGCQVEYVQDVTDLTLPSALFIEAYALLLASRIAPRVTGGDPYKLGPLAYQKYQQKIHEAQNNSLNEEQVDVQPESEFVRARTGADDLMMGPPGSPAWNTFYGIGGGAL